MVTVTVLDYGMGNLSSVARALSQAGGEVVVTRDIKEIECAERLVIPGQGAMPAIMSHIAPLVPTVRKVLSDRPFLGLCVGLQMLFGPCEEGPSFGLGVWPGMVKKLPSEDTLAKRFKVPHMGWNTVQQMMDHPLWHNIEDNEYFYFVHSYYCAPEDSSLVTGQTDYSLSFASACGRDNLFAVQFHPEKSAGPGLQFLKNFLHWQP